MADGPTTVPTTPWGLPRKGRLSSQETPGPSMRASRGFFSSLFSSPKGQQPPVMRRHYQKAGQPLPERFDAISLTSPSQRDDPAFSRDPSVHHAHPLSSAPRDFIMPSAPVDSRLPPPPVVAVDFTPRQPSHAPSVQQAKENRQSEAHEITSSFASQASLALPPSDDSFSSSPMSPSSSSSFLSHLNTPAGTSEEAHEDPPALVASLSSSPVAETHVGAYSEDKTRPMSPPPEYEVIATPRPSALRNDSAPELRHIDPPGLPHRSATAPIPATQKRPNDRRPQAYDLDRIDELDESNPLGVALHHEGPFQAIASVLKGPSPLGNQSIPPQPRPVKMLKPGYHGGSLGISPGQVLPRDFFYQPTAQPVPRQEYGGPPQASTSRLPQMLHAPTLADGGWAQSYPSQAPQHGNPPYDVRGTPPPHPTQPSYDNRTSYDVPAPYIPPQTQYDPVEVPPQDTNSHRYLSAQQPSGHSPSGRSSFYSEDISSAYGGMEEDLVPKRDRRSAPPVPTAAQAQSLQPWRHSARPEFAPPIDPRTFHDMNLNASQNTSDLPHSPNGQPMPAGFIDPRLLQHRDQLIAGQNLSGMRRSPGGQLTELNDSRQQHFFAPVAGTSHHARPDEHDRRRPASYQPLPTMQPPPNFNRTSYQQQQVGHHPMLEHDPRRRTSHLPPPGAAPPDLGRQQLNHQPHVAPVLVDRQQSVAPSVVSSTNPRRGPQPQHIPKHLIMPTPLQQTSQLPHHNPLPAYPAEHYPPGLQHVRAASQPQPTRAETIQMVQDGGRHLLRKRSSVVPASSASAPMPPKAPPVTRTMSYMEPPPTVPSAPTPSRAMQTDKKRPKRLLSKRRTDL